MNPTLFASAGFAGAHLVQLAADVEAVERELMKLVASQIKVVHEVGLHTLEAGGKRLRPAFLILSARATGRKFEVERAIRLGACMELIHMATLIHDDVVDESPTRRGRPTAGTTFGNTPSILSGDVMLARAMTVLAADGDLRIIRKAAEAVVEMAEGEAREVEVRGEMSLSLDDHRMILRKKTASFVECCCALGAMITDVDEATIHALGRYGHHLGMAFQFIDDLLDYRGDTKKTGKTVAQDFRDGCATLPLILALKKLSAEDRAWLGARFGVELPSKEVPHLLSLLEKGGGLAAAEAEAQAEVDHAFAALSELPKSSHRDLLEAAGRFVLGRHQ